MDRSCCCSTRLHVIWSHQTLKLPGFRKWKFHTAISEWTARIGCTSRCIQARNKWHQRTKLLTYWTLSNPSSPVPKCLPFDRLVQLTLCRSTTQSHHWSVLGSSHCNRTGFKAQRGSVWPQISCEVKPQSRSLECSFQNVHVALSSL